MTPQATDRVLTPKNRSDGGQQTIKVVVGPAANRKTFKLPKSLLRAHSGYFSAALRDGNEDRFVEAGEGGEFSWPDDDPDEFHRYVRWMYTCSGCRQGDAYSSLHVCCKLKDGVRDDPHSWCGQDVEPEQAFVLGDRILAPEYCRFALASLIQHAQRLGPRRLVWVLENAREGSPLHRFVRAWAGWMKYRLDKRQSTADEADGEEAAAYSELFASFDGWASADPRKYLMEHWLEPCSLDRELSCDHRRPHWFWRRTASGQPGSPPGREPRARSRGEVVWAGSLGVWVSHPRQGAVRFYGRRNRADVCDPPPVRMLRGDAGSLCICVRERPRRLDFPLVEGARRRRGVLCLCRDVHRWQLGALGLDRYGADFIGSCNRVWYPGCGMLPGMSTWFHQQAWLF